MKKFLSIILLLMLMLPLIPQGIISLNTSAAIYGDLEYTISNGEVTITGYVDSPVEVVVPSTIEGYPVTSIGRFAFANCTSLTSITIPNSVTSIGEAAFSDCSNLTNINISKDNPCYHSAGNCLIETKTGTLIKGFNDSVIPKDESVTSIGQYAFASCDSLTSIVIPNSVTSIGEAAFFYCSNLTSITIPDSVTTIGAWAFSFCDSLTSITIPNSVTSIGEGAFYSCDSLTSITIPDSITSIEVCAFGGCSNLISIDIPDSVTSIGEGAFEDCTKLTSITIPNSVTSIGEGAFSWCTSLTSIVIPNSVTTIGARAFYGCGALKTVYYLGTEEDKANIDLSIYDNDLLNAEWLYHTGNTHVYDNDSDPDCNECGLIRNPGDLDRDEQITVSDALAALRIAAKMAECTDIALRIGDMDGDGKISVADALAILRIAAKMS